MSKNAFAFGVWKGTPQFRKLALAAGLSLRQIGHKEDIVFCTVEPDTARWFESRGWQAQLFDVIDYPALHRYSIRREGVPDGERGRIVSWCDGQKFNFWSVQGYNKVFAIDADVLFRKPAPEALWACPSLTVTTNEWRAPLASGLLLLTPDVSMRNDMVALLQKSTFDLDTGWNGYGLVSWRCSPQPRNWNFQAANNAQGFLYYYFHILHQSLYYFDQFPELKWPSWLPEHFSGTDRVSQEYYNQSMGVIGHL